MSDTPPDVTGDATYHGIGSLALAMSKAQAEIKVAVFDKQANYGKYASFKAVREVSIDALSKHQIAIFQPVHFDGTNYFLETLVVHSSGESISSKIKLLIDRNNMQGLGSAITYAKRYAWASIIGVVSDDDDDGQAVSNTEIKTHHPIDRKIEKKAEQSKANAGQAPQSTSKANFAPASKAMIDQINGLCIDRKVQESELNYLINKGYGSTPGSLPTWIAKEILDLLRSPDTNSGTVMAQAQRVISRRQSAEILKNQPPVASQP